jgi:hypothetical protein
VRNTRARGAAPDDDHPRAGIRCLCHVSSPLRSDVVMEEPSIPLSHNE